MKTMTDGAQQQTWLSAIAAAAKLQQFALPPFDQYGMGSLRCKATATGRFVTLKRCRPKAEADGVEWALWHQPGDFPVLVAAFRDALEPNQERVAATLPLLKGWLVEQWTPDEAKAAVSKHPGVQPVKDPPPQADGPDPEKSRMRQAPATPSAGRQT